MMEISWSEKLRMGSYEFLGDAEPREVRKATALDLRLEFTVLWWPYAKKLQHTSFFLEQRKFYSWNKQEGSFFLFFSNKSKEFCLSSKTVFNSGFLCGISFFFFTCHPWIW